MKPFHQGKLDVFCAIYAVLNGLKLTRQIRTLHAREILHECLLGLAQHPDAFQAVLEQRTDYVALVDTILNIQSRKMQLQVEAPFAQCMGMDTPNREVLWQHFKDWLKPGHSRAVVFRFLRYITPESLPINKHWTTAHIVEGDTLRFFDCSLETEAV